MKRGARSQYPPLAADTVDRLRELGGEDLLKRLVTLLLELAPLRLGALEQALRGGDLAAARMAAHALCSTAGTVGATGILRAARRVEKAPALPEAAAAAGILEVRWRSLQGRLHRWLSAPASVT